MKRKSNQKKLSKKIERTPGLDIDDFEQSCNDLLGLCKIIKNQNPTNQSLLKNFIKIRLVSIVEFNFKGFISDLIDSQNLDPKKILDEDSIIIDLDVLQNLKSDEYTKGKIVVAHLDKMNPGIVYSIMSKINQVDSFKWFDQLLNLPKNTCWSSFKDLYRERNDLTHNLIDTDDSVETLTMKIEIIMNLILALYIFTNLNLDIYQNNDPESVIEKNHGKSLKNLKLNLKQFKDVTTKFKKEYKPFNKKY